MSLTGVGLIFLSRSASNRESFRTFHELSEIFSDENNHSLSRELLIKVRGPAAFTEACWPRCVYKFLSGARTWDSREQAWLVRTVHRLRFR